jgi:tetratricopeptide (TPR) repeat protein
MHATPNLVDRPRWTWSFAGVIVALCFLSYLYVMLQAQWIWDDPDYVWRNPNLVEDGGFQAIWTSNAATPQYYPIVHSTFWFEYRLIDPDVPYQESLPAGLFHFNNVLIFALTALAFWKVLLRLRLRGALIAVLLFAVHPVNVESVAWVTERKNMLSGLFGMLVVLSIFRFLRIGDDDENHAAGKLEEAGPAFAVRKKQWMVLLGSLLGLFALSFYLKSQVDWMERLPVLMGGVTALAALACGADFIRARKNGDGEPSEMLPVLLWGPVCSAFVFWTIGILSKSVIAFVPPALALILWWKRPALLLQPRVIAVLLFLLIPGASAGLHTAFLEETQVGAEDVFFPEHDHFFDRVMLAGTVVWVYFKHFIAPYQQMFFYPKWDPETSVWWQWVLLLGAIALPITLLLKSKVWGRGPLVAVLIFGGALVPVMGFANVYPMRLSWVADHFQYHANFAMFALLGAALVRIRIPQKAGKVTLGVALLCLVGLSNLHGQAFKNAESLWRHTIDVNPESWIAYENLAVEVNKRAIAARAEGDETLARELESEAMDLIYSALSMSRDPHLLQSAANNHLGWYSRYKRPADLDAAEELVTEALLKWERYGMLHKLMGDVHLARNRAQEAVESNEKGLHWIRTQEFQREFIERKFTSTMGLAMATNLSVGLLEWGRRELSAGNAAAALEIWSRARQPYDGPGSLPLMELYAWGPPNRFFELEVHRLWMLAAYSDPEVRNPQLAFDELNWFMQNAGGRLTAAGVPADMQARYQIGIIDLQAATAAAMGQFQSAIEASAEALRRARDLRAPQELIQGLTERNQSYREKKAYRFSRRVPFVG